MPGAACTNASAAMVYQHDELVRARIVKIWIVWLLLGWPDNAPSCERLPAQLWTAHCIFPTLSQGLARPGNVLAPSVLDRQEPFSLAAGSEAKQMILLWYPLIFVSGLPCELWPWLQWFPLWSKLTQAAHVEIYRPSRYVAGSPLHLATCEAPPCKMSSTNGEETWMESNVETMTPLWICRLPSLWFESVFETVNVEMVQNATDVKVSWLIGSFGVLAFFVAPDKSARDIPQSSPGGVSSHLTKYAWEQTPSWLNDWPGQQKNNVIKFNVFLNSNKFAVMSFWSNSTWIKFNADLINSSRLSISFHMKLSKEV